LKAAGEHIVVRIPTPKTQSEGGIELPQHVQEQQRSRFMYGRIESIGIVAREKIAKDMDDYAIFDPNGKIEIELDPVKRSGIAALHWSQVLATVSGNDLEDANLPI
jgi:hypothetical protein